MENRQTNILCIGGCLLGNETVTAAIKQALDSQNELATDYIFIRPEDYACYRIPKWRQLIGMTAEILYIIQQKIKDIDFAKYDMVIAQGFEVGWAVNNKVDNIPCIMFSDATPVASHELICKCRYYSVPSKLRSLILVVCYRIFFRNIFTNIDMFFPQTNWCGESLTKDFGISAENVARGTIAVDLDRWQCVKKDKNRRKVNLLFVGNDFKRKGGDFLLDLYSRIADRSELVIISNDKILDSMNLPPGVCRHKNIPYGEMSKYFCDADIFVFPTLKEHFGIVHIEALGSGLPVISRDIGGVSDAVINNYNGYLMPYYSTAEEWARKIEYLIDHPDKREYMGLNSRKLAEEKYGMMEFETTIRSAINGLIGK